MDPNNVKRGLAVVRHDQPGVIGTLTGRTMHPSPGTPLRIQVNWGHRCQYECIEDLEEQGDDDASIDSSFERNRFGGMADLRRRLTFEKMQGQLTDLLYSMKTSAIDFYPHQFAPVLRFVESATNRLLIADEVGLGKTIEAGLIWREWQARDHARRLLVVCKPSLVPKWCRELQVRFQLQALPANATDVLSRMQSMDVSGMDDEFALVSSYHALRCIGDEQEKLDALLDRDEPATPAMLERSPPRVRLLYRIHRMGELARIEGERPFLDMVVFDEAHEMKNTDTASHHLGELLSAASGAALCLTATPVTVANRDLYSLLRLIDPDVFEDAAVFRDLVERNLPVVRLQNALDKAVWDRTEVRARIKDLPDPTQRAYFEGLLAKLDDSPESHLQLRRQAQKHNLLSNFVNRTRKQHVAVAPVLRRAATIEVALSEAERRLYDAVLHLIRSHIQKAGLRNSAFYHIQPALRMSSSMPVVVEDIRRGRWGGFDEIALLEEAGEDEQKPEDVASAGPALPSLSELAITDFEACDSKFKAFLACLRNLWAGNALAMDDTTTEQVDPREKVIVFAFFKATIAYLQRRLTQAGIPSIAVTGDITDNEERDRLLTGFRSDNNRVLLCSEIGAEGIDLQFARVVVNYDLPWNPMRVEQRIGRVDRLGQKSSSIIIINFHVQDTIDGKVYQHLYKNLGIFSSTIGDPEEILGDRIEEINRRFFSGDLSPDEVIEYTTRTRNSVLNRSQSQKELESSATQLMSFQDVLSEEVDSSQRLGRFIKPEELRLHAMEFFQQRYGESAPCQVFPDTPVHGCLSLKLSVQAMVDFEQHCQAKMILLPPGFHRQVALCFDPELYREARIQNPTLLLATHLHPMFRWITETQQQEVNSWYPASSIRVNSREIPPGNYLYLVGRFTFSAITKRDTFHYIVFHLDDDTQLSRDKAEMLLNQVREHGEDQSEPQMDLLPSLERCRMRLYQDFAEEKERFFEDQNRKSGLRQQQAELYFNRRIHRVQSSLEKMRVNGIAEGRMRGFQTMERNLREKLQTRLTHLRLQLQQAQGNFVEVCAGVVKVTS